MGGPAYKLRKGANEQRWHIKQLAIDWSELTLAFDSSSWQLSYYLDTETGQVLAMTDETRQELEQIYEEYFDEDNPDAFDIEAVLAQRDDLPGWQKEALVEADFVETHYGRRVIAIPDTPTYEAYNEMQEYIATIEDDRLYNRLLNATRGRGAFGRFRDILHQHPAVLQRWYAFQENRLRQRILEWLKEEGIEPVDVPPAAEATGEEQV